MSIKQGMVAFGSRFAFEFFLEVVHNDMVKGLRSYLKDVTTNDIMAMVKEERFPPLQGIDFSALAPNAEHAEKIDGLRVMEFIGEARPDLAEVIQSMGMDGANYIVKLRYHILDKIWHPEKGLASETNYTLPAETKMVTLNCDQCGKSWAVPKEETSSVKECPFCHKQ